MRTTSHGWTVLDEAAGVYSYTYSFGNGGRSNCFTARLADGTWMVISPPSNIPDAAIDELAQIAEVGALVANNGWHHLGFARWRERFPAARCFAAEGARARIRKKSATAGELEPLSALASLLSDEVAVTEAPGSKDGETWAWAKIDGGYAWYASDILANLDKLPPKLVLRLLFKLSNSAPGYRVFNLAVRFIFSDRKAGLTAMLADVRQHPPRVMVPAHGGILDGATVADDTIALLEAAL